ncbi:MAG: hypothetical protein GX106_01595 [Candidatus Cloacimonetes bacterium]|jgi:excinuclease UvrABC nuclease subunit|nr:hypothetical protein [Candidatus Cloacimonadota bacterium]
MISIQIDKNTDFNALELPKGWIFYVLAEDEKPLYSGISARLLGRLNTFSQRTQDDKLIAEMMQRANFLSYETLESSFAALILHKCFVSDNAPEYQNRIVPWENYVYLGIDSHRFPFVSIEEHTNGDWQYIGPFRSRFFLAEMMDTISRILKLPHCETGSYPCDKFDRDVCRGWCLALNPSKESKSVHDLDKLDSLLKEAWMHPNNGVLEMLQKERDSYFNDLEFIKADLLNDEIELLSDYRDWLNFLYVAKDLNFENDDLLIRNGQLLEARLGSRYYHFPADSPEYRPNETLALPLSKCDEMKIIYDYIRELNNASKA